jgi:cation transport ATPase
MKESSQNTPTNKSPETRTLGSLVIIFAIIFSFGVAGGHIWHWMSNEVCYRYIGCNVGFFGYDAIVHLFGGVLIVLTLLWLMRRYPSLNVLRNDNFSENFLILLAIVALVGIGWEIMEFSFDHWRTVILNENLLNPNTMAQPSNSDTMGDLVFGLFGGALTIFFTKNK